MLHIVPGNNLCFPEKSREQALIFLSGLWRTESFPSEPYLWWISPPQVFPFPSLCFYNINPPHQYQNINNNPLCIWFNRGFPLGYSMEALTNFFLFPSNISENRGKNNIFSWQIECGLTHPAIGFFQPCINQGDVPVPQERGLLIIFRLTKC